MAVRVCDKEDVRMLLAIGRPVKNLKILARNGLIRYSLLHRTNGMIVNLTDWRILGMVRNRTHAIGLSYMIKPMI